MGLCVPGSLFLILLLTSNKVLCKNDESVESQCLNGSFYDEAEGKCQMCSQCKPNEIVIRTCLGSQDTKCGRYTDYINFSFLARGGQGNDSRDGTESTEKLSPPEVIQANEEERQWKTLAFVLIGMISALFIAATIVVIISCHRFRNYQWLCKAVSSEQGADDLENGYVVIHKFIPPAATVTNQSPNTQGNEDHVFVEYRGRSNRRFNGGYRPKRRMMNEYVDDVFDSDDSAGSRILPTIMEKPGESEGSSLTTP